MRDLLVILRRLPLAMPWVRRRYPAQPWPWARCHCGDLAEYHSEIGVNWCWPCKYAGHPTCECSDPETWEANARADREDRS